MHVRCCLGYFSGGKSPLPTTSVSSVPHLVWLHALVVLGWYSVLKHACLCPRTCAMPRRRGIEEEMLKEDEEETGKAANEGEGMCKQPICTGLKLKSIRAKLLEYPNIPGLANSGTVTTS